ncbi:MAG: M20 family metallo-hydrolase [Alphaproteobacteria bacterium]|nr:M20 family metallo-hydrolase [Alphaproteobacteria bacterium]
MSVVERGGTRPSDLVDVDRLWRRLMRLAEFGATSAGGVNRQALSEEEIAARKTLAAWAREAGLNVLNDPIGNMFFRLEGADPDAAPVLSGSHIDSQPTGGKFDGTFGVLAALEALCALALSARKPRRSIEAVAWTNEEGSRFAPGMMGSEAFTGQRALERMLAVEDVDGTSVRSALAQVIAAEPEISCRPLGFPVHAYVEAHIEQGPILEREETSIGVVSGIQGSRRFRVTVTGEAAHAGTTPRRDRKDAVLAAVGMINALAGLVCDPEDVMFTVGLFRVQPNAPSVVPREAYFSIDLRHPDNDVLTRLGDAVSDCCHANRGACTVGVEEIAHAPSLGFPGSLRETISAAAERLELSWREIPSAAGHDARQLHYHCDSGMIFIPCRDGISHNESEWTEPHRSRVLADVLWELADAR